MKIYEIQKYYEQPHRHYHNWGHIQRMITKLNKSGLVFFADKDYNIIHSAILYHDIIYDPERSDNEEQSASMYVEHAKQDNKVNLTTMDIVANMILATKTHVRTHSYLTNYLIDLDLEAISDRSVYFKNTDLIRKEYGHLTGHDFFSGRIKWITTMLNNRPTIYNSPMMKNNEWDARYNMKLELDLIKANLIHLCDDNVTVEKLAKNAWYAA